jgi:hypothetical protein
MFSDYLINIEQLPLLAGRFTGPEMKLNIDLTLSMTGKYAYWMLEAVAALGKHC